MYDDLIYRELKRLNETMESIASALCSIAAEGNECDTCTHFHEGGCELGHERDDGPIAPCVDGCPACIDYEFGPNSHRYDERGVPTRDWGAEE